MLKKSTKQAIQDAIDLMVSLGGEKWGALPILNLRMALEDDAVAPAPPKHFYPCIGNRGNDNWPDLPYVAAFAKPLGMNPSVASHGMLFPAWPDSLPVATPDGYDNEVDALSYAIGSWSIWRIQKDAHGYRVVAALTKQDVEYRTDRSLNDAQFARIIDTVGESEWVSEAISDVLEYAIEQEFKDKEEDDDYE